MAPPGPVVIAELRVLDGPNLYFTRPAVKLTVDVSGWLGATEGRASRAAWRAGLAGSDPDPSRARLRPGPPRSEHRRMFVARLAAHVTRSLAGATGTSLAVRSRPGPGSSQVVVAFPWRRRHAAERLARRVVDLLGLLLGSRRSFPRLLAEAKRSLASIEPGPAPDVPDPAIPVVAVTGTNGKTTTVRLLAHMGRMARRKVAYSSTDGVYVDGRLVQEGDYSGFGGAARALSEPHVDLAVLETARGGILLRGIGTLHNDVAVVTNVSADHLGLHGIGTLDQLAEVKATVTRITRPEGWDVLNADDPRVLAMRRGAKGRPWLYSLDPQHPALRTTLGEGGRATTVVDGRMTVLTPGGRASALVPLEEVPVTLAGIARHHVQNAMAAASAGLAVGLPRAAVVRGLTTFVLDERTNPGRANLFELQGRVIVVDYAHNEAGLKGLMEICRGLRRPGGEVWLAFSAAGDRTNDILHALGHAAARGADHVAVAELVPYLRGRDRADLIRRLTAGARDAGATVVPVYPGEVAALEALLASSRRGDVVAVTALGERRKIFALVKERGGRPLGPARVRALVRRARGLRR